MAAWSRCVGKQVMGHCRLVGGAFSIQFSSGAVPIGGGCPQYGSPREASSPGLPYLDSQLRQINSACLLLAITLMKLTPSSEGGQFCQSWWQRVSDEVDR